MRTSLLLLITAATAACSSSITSTQTALNDFASFNGAKVELSAEGGIAALSMTHSITHDSRLFVYVMRRICSSNCGAPLDSTGGTLSAAATDSLFNIVLEQQRSMSKDDYGITRNAADMMSYTLRITADGRVRTIRADDGTMPAEMRRIVQAVTGIVSAARR
jgi:hypothetical protein